MLSDWLSITGGGSITITTSQDATSSGSPPTVLVINGLQHYQNISGGQALDCGISAWTMGGLTTRNLILRSQNDNFTTGTYYLASWTNNASSISPLTINRVISGVSTTLASSSVGTSVFPAGTFQTRWIKTIFSVLNETNDVRFRFQVVNQSGNVVNIIDGIDAGATRITGSGNFRFGEATNGSITFDDITCFKLI